MKPNADANPGGAESAQGEPLGPQREVLWLFPKAGHERLSENFFLREFRCRCHASRCHMTLVHPALVESLQKLRETVRRPLMLTSGYRCPTYNRIVGGRARSFHTRGMAADILCQDLEQIRELAEAAGRISAFGGIGEYHLRRFVHLDVRPRGFSGMPEKWSD